MKEHFIALRVGLFDHVEDGRMTPTMFNVLLVILKQVDWRTGIWRGSAPKVHSALGKQIPLRTIRHSLNRLCEKGYLKSFRQHGSRQNYLVAVEKYPVRLGRWKGCRLDASATNDSNAPVYVHDAEQFDLVVKESAQAQQHEQDTSERANDVAVRRCEDVHDVAVRKAAQTHYSEQVARNDAENLLGQRNDIACIQDNQIRDKKKRFDSAALKAAQSAYRLFHENLGDKENAFRMLLWILYRAASARFPQVPQTLNYYTTADINFWNQDCGQEYMLDESYARFDKHAHRFIQAHSPELLDWLKQESEQLQAEGSLSPGQESESREANTMTVAATSAL